MATLIALPALALLGAHTASAAGSAFGGMTGGSGGGLGLTQNECRLLGGDVDDFGGGEWSCCMEGEAACFNCSGEVNGGADKNCWCAGADCKDYENSRLGGGLPILERPKGGVKVDRNTPATQPKASDRERRRDRRVKRLSEAERLELREKRAEQRELRERRDNRAKNLSKEERLERRKLRAERLSDRGASELTDEERLELRKERRDRRDRSRRDFRSK